MRKENTSEGSVWKGKIHTFLKSILEKLQTTERMAVHIILYTATQSAIENIRRNTDAYIDEKKRNIQVTVEAVQTVKAPKIPNKFEAVLKRDFETHNTDEYITFVDKHYQKGNVEKPYLGFNGCGLALVLYHNTPNNSFPAIWHSWEKREADVLTQKGEALFPRVTRHKEN